MAGRCTWSHLLLWLRLVVVLEVVGDHLLLLLGLLVRKGRVA